MTPDPRQSDRLEQVCPSPARGMREAAGSYCSCCATRTGPADWAPTARSDAQRAASRATGLRRQSRPEDAAVTAKSAPPAAVAIRAGTRPAA